MQRRARSRVWHAEHGQAPGQDQRRLTYTASTRRIREEIIEKEFVACFDRAFSQDALEEVGDEDFERFVDDFGLCARVG
jgi:hypothetical protein